MNSHSWRRSSTADGKPAAVPADTARRQRPHHRLVTPVARLAAAGLAVCLGLSTGGATAGHDAALSPRSVKNLPADTPDNVVVLIHGWQGLSDRQLRCDQGPVRFVDSPADSTFEALPDWLLADGFDPWLVRLDSGPESTPSLADNGECLAGQLAWIRGRTGARQVALIGHSMGGVVARAYMEDEDLYAGDVSLLVTLGAPHLGVPVDLEVALADFLGFPASLNCERQRALCEFTRGGMAQFNARHPNRRDDVDYRVVSGDIGFLDSTWVGRLLSAWLPGPDDGLVPLASGIGLTGAKVLETAESHGGEVLRTPLAGKSYFRPVPELGRSLAYLDCVEPALKGLLGRCGHTAVTLKGQSASGTLRAGPVVTGTLPAFGQASIPLSLLPEESAIVGISWESEDIAVSLSPVAPPTLGRGNDKRNPPPMDDWGGSLSELTLSRADARTRQPPGDRRVGQTFAIAPDAPRDWTAHLESQAAVSVDYSLFVASDGIPHLEVVVEPDFAQAGDNVRISAMPTGFEAQTITATLNLGGQRVTIPLARESTGPSHSANVTLPTAGLGRLRVEAQGSAGGVPITRSESLALTGASDHFSVEGPIAAVPVDTDADGRLDALAVTVAVTAERSGRVALTASLSPPGDSTGKDIDEPAVEGAIARAGRIAQARKGRSEITLYFDGSDLLAARGPLLLTSVAIQDLTRGYGLPSGLWRGAWTTPPLDGRIFGQPRAYLPRAIR